MLTLRDLLPLPQRAVFARVLFRVKDALQIPFVNYVAKSCTINIIPCAICSPSSLFPTPSLALGRREQLVVALPRTPLARSDSDDGLSPLVPLPAFEARLTTNAAHARARRASTLQRDFADTSFIPSSPSNHTCHFRFFCRWSHNSKICIANQ